MPLLALEDAELYFEVAGKGPPLVFAHGLGGNQLSWWQQVPHFAGRFTCVTFAHRGFNPSRGTPDPDRFGADLAALLDHLGIDDATFVAQSMGGWTCVQFALAQPKRVLALVLADTTGVIRFPEESAAPPSSDPGSGLAARGIHPACGERMAGEQPELHHLYREIDALSIGLDKAALLQSLLRLRNQPPELLRNLGLRLLWIWGREDVVLPPSLAELARAHFPKARVELVSEAGHSVYFERPREFNRLVDEFLS